MLAAASVGVWLEGWVAMADAADVEDAVGRVEGEGGGVGGVEIE